ncbi:LysR family transcriptional regulator [Paenibacillus turpanensis]|uniref:LysR family transcriptional regulator n=1 Tax=Paenibacillus turpanensis TaxID=2689078 RepID=UPI001A9E1B16|nr:LysR family transcriptional regulator [Paenibacillus turpanensis]
MIEHFDIFAAIVENQSMNKASEKLNLSQPALSRKIAGLEEELGVKLFYRKGKRLELTRIGHLTYEYAVEMRNLQERYMRMLSEFKTPQNPRVMIGASLTTLQSTLPDLLSFLNSRKTDLDVKVVTGKTHEIVELVLQKRVDIGVVAQEVNEPDLSSIPLLEDKLMLIAPDHHSFAGSPAGWSLKDLHGLPMILFSKGTWYRKLVDDLFEQHGIVPDVKMEIDSFEAMIRLSATCGYATLLPRSYVNANQLQNNGLIVIHIPELEQLKRVTSLIFGDREALSPSVRELIDLTLQEYIKY